MELQLYAERMRGIAGVLQGTAVIFGGITCYLALQIIRVCGIRLLGKKTLLAGLLLGLAGYCAAVVYAEEAEPQEILADGGETEESQEMDCRMEITDLQPVQGFCQEELDVQLSCEAAGTGIRRIEVEANGRRILEEHLEEASESVDHWEKRLTLPIEDQRELQLLFRMYDWKDHMTERQAVWICDREAPQLSVQWEGQEKEGYFSSEGAIIFLVREKHFQPELWEIDREEMPEQSGGSWQQVDAETYRYRMPFQAEGNYRIRIRGQDPAGNVTQGNSEDGWFVCSWTVDRTSPEIQIRGVEEKEECRGKKTITVEIKDLWLDESSCHLQLQNEETGTVFAGWKKGKNGTYCMEVAEDPEGEEDGRYQLEVQAEDRAGNLTLLRRSFVRNHKGSRYQIQGIQNGRLQEDQPLILTEENRSPVVQSRIFYLWEGETRLLEEGKDYIRTEEEGEWKKYRYRFPEQLFARDGDYQLLILSEDQVGNQMGNQKNRFQQVPIRFQVHRVVPSLTFQENPEEEEWQAAPSGLQIPDPDIIQIPQQTESRRRKSAEASADPSVGIRVSQSVPKEKKEVKKEEKEVRDLSFACSAFLAAAGGLVLRIAKKRTCHLYTFML